MQPNKEVSVEKSFKTDEEDGAKPKPTETRKVSRNTIINDLFRIMMADKQHQQHGGPSTMFEEARYKGENIK